MWWMANLRSPIVDLYCLVLMPPPSLSYTHTRVRTSQKCCNSSPCLMRWRTRRQEWGWNPFMSPWEDVYFSKLLLTYRHALAQSEQRCARGERKARFTANEGVWGWAWEEGAIYGWWMRGGKGCRLSDVPLIFPTILIRRSRQSWMRGRNEGQRWRDVIEWGEEVW